MVLTLVTGMIQEPYRLAVVQSLNDHVSYAYNVWATGPNKMYVSTIGMPAESTLVDQLELDHGMPTFLGKDNIFREFVTVHAGVEEPTRIGSNCLFMTKSHVGHDAQIGDRVTVSPSAMIGGHCIIEDDVTIGMGAVIHQRTKIHKGAMIGMGSVVTHEVAPYSLVYGNPARPHDINWKKFKEHGEPWNELWNYNYPAFNEYYGVA